ncbi:MAG TPA: SRPBCC family protein, partial [bacterium]|nr:SRPBCC family protein [bacterium]
MRVLNIHERDLDATPAEVGRLIDSLSSPADVLWPSRHWPAMRFDRPLQVEATGGHGPIRYFVEAYEPGWRVQFHFTGPEGFLGFHAFVVQEIAPGRTRLRHVLEMETVGPAVRTWPLV